MWRMPAEWHTHARCWIGWPSAKSLTWRNAARDVQPVLVAVVEAVSQCEPVAVVVRPEEEEEARAALPPGTQLLATAMNDIWLRDSGPCFLLARAAGDDAARSCSGSSVREPPEQEQQGAACASSATRTGEQQQLLAGVAWQFNGWGGLAPGYEADQGVAEAILRSCGALVLHGGMVLEGGSIHVDGCGTLLTTEECLLNANRNPGLSKAQIEQRLQEALGVARVIWLPRGLHADVDTSGHVDNIACFARPGVVLLAWTDDERDPQFERSQEALRVLSSSEDAQGRRLQVVKLPLPPPQYRSAAEAPLEAPEQPQQGPGLPYHGQLSRRAGDRLAASYVNFYLPNGGVVVPAFGCPDEDAAAQEVLRRVFPGRRVVGVQTRELLLGGGNIHCITLQQPAA